MSCIHKDVRNEKYNHDYFIDIHIIEIITMQRTFKSW